jgi:gliding motility-associated-like protein
MIGHRYMKRFYFLFLLFIGFLKIDAQIDTSFWFVAPDISSSLGQTPIKMYVTTYGAASNVYLRQPANGTFVPISKTIPAFSLDSIDLTSFVADVESTPSNSVLPRGIYISASTSVSIVYTIKSPTHKEMISLKGTKAVGTDFYTPFQNAWRTAMPTPTTNPRSASAIDIVATQNATSILITPRANIIGHAKDVSFIVVLNAGETFSCQDTTTLAPTKLGGTIISANKPVAITVSSSNLLNGGSNSTVADQITNSSYAGNDFVIAKSQSGNDKYFILASVNSTSLTIYNGTSTVQTLINTGETYSASATQALTYIKSTKPVYVLHVSAHGSKLSGAQVPHFYCAGTYSTSFTRTTNDSLSINVFTRTGYEGNFTLLSNSVSQPVPASAFTVVPGTGGTVVGAKIYYPLSQIPLGSYNILSNTGDIYGFGTHQGSNNNGSTYAYHSEWASYPFAIAGPLSATTCANSTFTLNGVVGGGNITGAWTTTGFGSFAGGTVALTNTYVPSNLDTNIVISLTSTGQCPSSVGSISLHVNPAPIVNASFDQVLCGNNATVSLNGNVVSATNTGSWSTTGTGVFSPTTTIFNPQYFTSSADTAAGQVKLVLTSTSNGLCKAETDTMLVTFTKPPAVNAGPTTITRCINNASIALTGTVSGASLTGKWTTTGTGIFNPNNVQLNTNYLPSSSDLASSGITIYLSSTNNGNCLPVTDSIKVNFTPSPNVNAGVDLSVCKNNYVTALNGIISGGATTGVWSGGAGVFSPTTTALSTSYTPASSEFTVGFVILTLTSTNNGNCLAVTDQVRIDFKDKPSANFASTTVCLNKNTQFTDASNPNIGALAGWDWSFGDGATSTAINPLHTYSVAGSFTATLIVKNSFNCYDTIQKPITVFNLPNAYWNYNRLCSGSALQINFTDSSNIAFPDTIGSYYWSFGTTGISSLQNPSQLFNFPGTYTITHIVTSKKGCTDTLSKPITITPRPQAGFVFTNNGGFNIGSNVVFLDTSKNAVNWYWNFDFNNPGAPTSTIQNPNNVYYANGTYTVLLVVQDQFGCSDSAKSYVKILTVKNEITELIPNAISPNGDGKNDIWNLNFINTFYPKAEIEIYNRWGLRIFHSIGYDIAWDGTYKGDALPVASYYFIINLNDPNRKENENIFKGTLLLMK